MTTTSCRTTGQSYYESNALKRITSLLDPGSFHEIIRPEEKISSPHLRILGQPCSFNDGIIVGAGRLAGKKVLIAGQEGGFMGGAVGEVHGAKLTGLLQRATEEGPDGVLLLLESGGVRLHEANAGLIAVSEIIRSVLAARVAGVPVIGLIGGVYGCFGGMGIVARCCNALIISEEGRMGLSGPEVIETTMGVEEFDASDRALVWRTVGGKHRYLIGEVQRLVDDDVAAFRAAAIELLNDPRPLSLEELQKEHGMLSDRLKSCGSAYDAIDIWHTMGIAEPETLPLLDTAAFHKAVQHVYRGAA